MKREAVLKLRDKVWIEEIIPDDPLAVAVVPAASIQTAALLFDPLDERVCRQVCERLFVDFRGYENGAADVPNSLEARLELYSLPAVRQAIHERVRQIEEETLRGEAGAASD